MSINSTCQDWRPVHNYQGLYEINRQGEVRSKHKRFPGHILQQFIDRSGYLTVKLSKNGRDTTLFLHRLLAFAFIPNPDNLGYVNHLNGVKTCNEISNLEWITHRDNMRHAYRLGLVKVPSKKVIDRCSGEVYNSAKEAAKHYNIRYNTLRNYLNGNIRTNPTCLEYMAEAA